MKNEMQTKEKLLSAAKSEFMEKGYMNASLRNICKQAGVTTGALYFFFDNKEDLFASIVKPPIDQLMTIMEEHYYNELKGINQLDHTSNFHEDDKEAAIKVLNYMYEKEEEFVLALTKSAGSEYEHCKEQFIAITEVHYRKIVDELSRQRGTKRVEDGVIHWISHIQTDAFSFLLEHSYTKAEAEKMLEQIIQFMTHGFYGLYQ